MRRLKSDRAPPPYLPYARGWSGSLPAETASVVWELIVSGEERVVEARLPDGGVVSIVAMTTDEHDPAQDIAARGVPSLDDVRSAITGMATLARDAVQAVRPDSASVEFGVDVKAESGKLGGLIVSGSANATLKVTLTWNSAPTPPSA